MDKKNKSPTSNEIFKYDIIELRRSITDLKNQKNITDVEILRYVYKTLGYMLNKNY